MARVLIVDDEQNIGNALRAALEGAGHEVVDAFEGEEGLSRYREKPAGLVILDLVMPGKDGLETLGELIQESPEPRIIAISGTPLYLPMATDLGASRTFAKPFSMKELLEAVEELTGQGGRTGR